MWICFLKGLPGQRSNPLQLLILVNSVVSCVIKQKKIINTDFRGQRKPKNVVCCPKAALCHRELMCCDVTPDYKVLQDMVVCFYLFWGIFSKMKKINVLLSLQAPGNLTGSEGEGKYILFFFLKSQQPLIKIQNCSYNVRVSSWIWWHRLLG